MTTPDTTPCPAPDAADPDRLVYVAEHYVEALERDLRDARAALWAAVRTLTARLPVEDASILLGFMDDDAPIATQQVALQALQSMLATERGVLPDDVKARVGEMVDAYLRPEWLATSDHVALAANAVCAARLAGVIGDAESDARLAALDRPALTHLVATIARRALPKATP